MGLLTGLISLPLAPVRGVIWLSERLAEQAEREFYDEGAIHRALDEARDSLDAGAMTEAEYRAVEDELLARLMEAHTRR
jgi:hypothetical protein